MVIRGRLSPGRRARRRQTSACSLPEQPEGVYHHAVKCPGVREGEAYAGALGADVDEIAKLCADLAAAAFIELMRRH